MNQRIALLPITTLLLSVTWLTPNWVSSASGSTMPTDNHSPVPAAGHSDISADTVEYLCPMHPHIHQGTPGDCPICGMDLVKKRRQSAAAPISVEQESHAKHSEPVANALPAVYIAPATSSLMAVRTSTVEKRTTPNRIETFGRVAYNEDNVINFVPRADGWVETLYVPHEGHRVKEGDKLLEFFSPEILSAQDGYVLALKNNFSFTGERREFFDRTAREKLKLYGLSPKLIQQLSDNGKLMQTIPLFAPRSGIITKLDVDQGDSVTTKSRFMVIADMSTVWVYADIYEHQLAMLEKTGQILVTSSAYPDKQWHATVDFIDTEFKPQTNTLKVRLRVDTPDEKLKAQMRVHVAIDTAPSDPVLTVPNEALIPESTHLARVIKVDEKGNYQPVTVKTGITGHHYTEILDGLKEKDMIVTSGQFLIDAESHLQAGLQRMQ